MVNLVAGLIGSHIQRTRLPRALKLMCRQAGIALQFELIDTADRPAFDFAATVDDLKRRGWTGVTITHPFKTDAAFYAGDALLPDLVRLGACNTLVFGPPMRGHNTDFTGFLSAWRWIMGDVLPGTVAMAGAGGVARALACALVDLGSERILVWDIEPGTADKLARDCGAPVEAISMPEAREAVRTADGLVNATPLGMEHAPGMAFEPHDIGRQRWAFDAVYTPVNTAFLETCRAAGLQCLTGFDLFCHMAIGSFEAYTGLTPDKASTLRKLAPLAP